MLVDHVFEQGKKHGVEELELDGVKGDGWNEKSK